MRTIAFSILTLFLTSCQEVSGPYLVQVAPGNTPEVFAPGIISHGFHELRITFSPEGDEAFYVIADKSYRNRVMVNVKQVDGNWSEPELVPFAWQCNNGSPSFSPDGSKVYYSSNRDNPHIVHDGSGLDIWYLEREGSSWSEPMKLSDSVNSSRCEHAPSVASSGNLYFSYTDESNQTFIYCSKYVNGQYRSREKIRMEMETDVSIGSPYIAPDESYLLFQANLPEGFGGNDIYISHPNEDGSWKAPINLGEKINSAFSDIGPRVSIDGKYLFFTSNRSYSTDEFKGKTYKTLLKMLKSPQNGYGTLYWVNAETTLSELTSH